MSSNLNKTPLFENTEYNYVLPEDSSGFNCHNNSVSELQKQLETDNHYDRFNFSKKKQKVVKKLKKLKSRSKFGTYAFETGTLPNAPGYNELTPLGLPPGSVSVDNIYQTQPDPYMQGSRLPRPYGPRDNMRMAMPELIAGFGKKKRSKKKLTKKIKKIVKEILKKRSKKRSKKKQESKKLRFGSETPGSPKWTSELANAASTDYCGIEYANPVLEGAKGDVGPNFLYYVPGSNFDQRFNLAGANVPMQYTDNQGNNPIPSNSFGFSAMSGTSSMTGPNNVGHETLGPMYHGGSNTQDFATGLLYAQNDIIQGPGNSTGVYASAGTTPNQLLKVKADSITPNAYLASAPDIKMASSGAYSARTLVNNGLNYGHKKKNKFGVGPVISVLGSVQYSPEFASLGTGQLTLYQPNPPQLLNR